MKKTLQILTQNIGISGQEENLFDAIKHIMTGYKVDVSCDNMGNIIVYKKGNKKGKIYLSAHIDEIGLIVTKIEGNYLRFTQIGGYDEKILLGQEVIVYADKEYNGIIGAKPPHLMAAEEQNKMLKFKDLYIDLGYNNTFLKKHINIGDRVSIKSEFIELKNDNIATKSMDNRSCATILLESLKELEHYTNIPDIYVLLNSQEETTGLGAKTSAYTIEPDIGIVLDVTIAKQPGVKKGYSINKIAIAKGADIHPAVFGFIKNTAIKESIDYEIEALPRGSGTDTYSVQIAGNGIATGLLSVPVKNMHSPVEIVNLKTMNNMKKLIVSLIRDINTKEFGNKKIK